MSTVDRSAATGTDQEDTHLYGTLPLCTNYELRLMTGRSFNQWLDQFEGLWDIPDDERCENRDYLVLFADGLERAPGVADRLISWETPVSQEEVLPFFNQVGETIRLWAEDFSIGLPIRVVYGRLEDAGFYEWLERIHAQGDPDLFADTPPKLNVAGLQWWLN